MLSKALLKTFLSALFLTIFLVGCGGGGGGASSTTSASGLPSHGPFVEGTEVIAVQLDENGTEVSANTQSATVGADYKFSFSNISWSGPTIFKIVDGQYYNEATGGYSVGSLRAVENVVAGETPNVNINILTDIAATSILSKMAEGTAIEEAKESAREAVVKTFGISLPDGADLEDIDLTDGSDESETTEANAQLLQLSAAILSTDNPDEVIENISNDLSDGEVDEDGQSALEDIESQEIDLNIIKENMENELENLDSVPNQSSLEGTLKINHSISFKTEFDRETSSEKITSPVQITSDDLNGASATISVSDGSYEISSDKISWSSSATTINVDDYVRLKQIAADTPSTEKVTTLYIGGAPITFKTVTKSAADDKKVNSFTFGFVKDLTPEATATVSTANIVTVSGLSDGVSVPYSVKNGTVAITRNGLVVSTSTVQNGDEISVSHTSGSGFFGEKDTEGNDLGIVKTTVTIGEDDDAVSGIFTSFTTVKDTNPNEFKFNNKLGQEISTDVYSDVITISGINSPTEISTDIGIVEVSTDDGTTWETATTVSDGNKIRVVHESSSEYETEVKSTLKIGKSIVYFISKTKVEPIPENKDPELTVNDETILEDNDASISYTATDDSVVASVEAFVDESKGSVAIDTTNSKITFKPKVNFSGDVLINVVATDDQGAVDSKDVKVTVTAVNDDPTLNIVSSASVDEDNILAIRFTAKDVDGDDLTTSILTQPTNGSAVIENGKIIFTPNENFYGEDSLIIQTTDGTTSVSETIGLTIYPINDAPVGVDDTQGTPQNVNLTVSKATLLANDTDIENDSLTLTAVSNAVGGTVSIDGDNVVFIPETDRTENASFEYTLSDGEYTSTATVTVIFNASPIANNDDGGTTNEDTPLTIALAALLANDEDLEEDTLSITTVLNAQGGEAVISGTDVVFTPTENYYGPASFDYTLSDGNTTSVASVGVNVNALNDTPILTGTPETTIAEDSAYSFVPTSSDVDGDTLVFSITNKPSWASFDNETGALTGTPKNEHVGSTSDIVISVTDNIIETPISLASFDLEVTNTNDAPTDISLDNSTVVENSGDNTLIGNLSSVDVDVSDTRTFSLVSGEGDNHNASFTISGAKLILINSADYETQNSYSIRVRVTDGSNATYEKVFTISVTNVNEAPVASDDDVGSTNEDDALTIAISTLVSNDVDVDTNPENITMMLSNFINGTAEIIGQNVVFTPSENYSGIASFDYTLNDGEFDSNTVTVTLNVLEVNDPAVIEGMLTGFVTEDMGTPAGGMVNSQDVDGTDNLFQAVLNGVATYGTYSIDTSGSWSYSLDDTKQEVQALASKTQVTDSFVITSEDGTTKNIIITIDGANDAPVANNDSFSTQINTPITINKSQLLENDSDVDSGDVISVGNIDLTSAANGTLMQDASDLENVTFIPANNFSGVATFTYEAMDSDMISSNTATVTITVSANTAPVAVEDSNIITIIEDNDATIAIADLVANDTDGESDSLTILETDLSNAVNGTVSIVGSNVVFTPEADYNGTASFEYKVNDGIDSSSNSVTVTLTIEPDNDAPIFTGNFESTVFETRSVDGTVSATDIDNDDNTLTYSLGNSPDCGNAVVNTDGSYTYTNTDANCEDDSFTIIAYDGTDYSSAVSVNINIKDSLVAVDPYIVGAQFCADINGNGTCDDGVDPTSTITDENGNFTFSAVFPYNTPIIMLDNVKGTHVGVDFDGLLKGTIGSPVITPLTTMVGNGFTVEQIIQIMANAGISGMTADHLAVDPMSLFSGDTVQTEDYPVMHAVIAVNTFLRMTDYGLKPSDALDENGDLVSPYAEALQAAVQLAQAAIKPQYIDAGASPRIVVYIGVAISNYLVDKVASLGQIDGFTFLTTYLAEVTNSYDTSRFKAHIDMLVAAYMSDPTKYYALSQDGSQAVNPSTLGAVSFTLDGYDFTQRFPDGDERYLVNGNSVVLDDSSAPSLVTLTASKDSNVESRTGVKTYFDKAQQMILAKVRVTDTTNTSDERLQVSGYMYDKHSLTGIFANISLWNGKLYLYTHKEIYQENGSSTEVALDGGDLAQNESKGFQKTLYDPSSALNDVNLGLSISVNPLNGILTFTVLDENGTPLANEPITIPDFDKMNLGFDNSEVRVSIKTGSTKESVTGYLVGFDSQDLEYTTATIASGDTVLGSDKDLSWIDIINLGTDTVTINMYENDGTSFKYEEGEVESISYNSSTSFNLLDGSDTIFTCTLSNTNKFNIFNQVVYENLFRSKNTCVAQIEHNDSNTWYWEWWKGQGLNGTDLDPTYDNFVSVFTNGYTYFEVSNDYVILLSDGTAVLGAEDGTWDNGEPRIVATSTLVGQWQDTGSSINVDLSSSYNALKSFNLDSNGMIVDATIYQVGYEEVDYIWTGSDKMDFFEDITGWNLNSALSGKVITFDIPDGSDTETLVMSFYASGRFTERVYFNDTFSESCYGIWREFEDDTFAFTCDNSNTEPTNILDNIALDHETRVVSNDGTSTNLTFTIPTGDGITTETATPTVDSSYQISKIETVVSGDTTSEPAYVGDYTVIAYASQEVSGSGTSALITLAFSVNGENSTITVSPDYENVPLMLKVFDSNGALVANTEYKLGVAPGGYTLFGELLNSK